MKSSKADKAFILDCLMAGGAIKDLADMAIGFGWSPRKFRVLCEYAIISKEGKK